MNLVKQEEYCKVNNKPMFAPLSGNCWSCGKRVTDNDKELITSCNRCNKSFCD